MSPREDDALASVLAELVTDAPIETRLRRIADRALDALGAARVVLYEIAADQPRPLVVRPPGALPAEIAMGTPLEARALAGEVVAVDDAGRETKLGSAGPVLVIPVRRAGVVLGALRVEAKPGRPAFDRRDERRAGAFADALAAALAGANDPLTGLRRADELRRALDEEVARTNRYDRPLSVVVFDVDHFRTVNARLGHVEGDAVLQGLGERIRATVRASDVPCRWGGDELCVLLPETPREGARAFAAKILAAARELGVTLSAGIATAPLDGSDATAVLRCADRRMFAAKTAGRDAIIDTDPPA